jgi:hypothetical protein
MEQAITETRRNGREKVKPSAEAIIERKLRMLELPAALVLAPRTSEGHLMTKILFGLDRTVNKLRMSAGGSTKISDVVKMMAEINSVISELEKVAASFGAGDNSMMFESPEAKRMLAARRTSYVFVPRTEEGQRVAYIIKRLDPQLVQLRTTCTDFAKVGKTIASVSQIVSTMNEVVESIAQRLNVDYYPPKALEQVSKS